MKIIVCIFFIILSSLLIWFFNPQYNFSDVKDYLSFLGVVSSMIFTLMGIWVAFLYPNALKRIVDLDVNVSNVDFSTSKLESKRLESIISSILVSGFVVIVAMFIFFFKIIFHSSSIYIEYIVGIKSFVLIIIVGITILQISAILDVLFSNVMFLNDLYEKEVNKKLEEDVGGHKE